MKNYLNNNNFKLLFEKFNSVKSKKYTWGIELSASEDLKIIDTINEEEFVNFYGKFYNYEKCGFCQFLFREEHNINEGSLATLLDIMTTIGMSSFDEKFRYNVSSNLKIQFSDLNDIKINKKLIISCHNLCINQEIGFCESNIYDYNNKKLLVTSQHVKGLIKKTWI